MPTLLFVMGFAPEPAPADRDEPEPVTADDALEVHIMLEQGILLERMGIGAGPAAPAAAGAD